MANPDDRTKDVKPEGEGNGGAAENQPPVSRATEPEKAAATEEPANAEAGGAAQASGAAGDVGGAGAEVPAGGVGDGTGATGAGGGAPASKDAGNGGDGRPAMDFQNLSSVSVPDVRASAVTVRNVRVSGTDAVNEKLKVKATEPTPTMAIGKKLTLWVLSILAGSIVLLLIYLWSMERTAADDIRRNYGKDLSRNDGSLYMAERIQRFSSDLESAQKEPSYFAPKNHVDDDRELSETLALLPDVTAENRTQLIQCVERIAAPERTEEKSGEKRADKLTLCSGLVEKVKERYMMAATAAFSLQMASEASNKLLEERQNLHEFWLKAAQLILLNLLLPVLTAMVGYTFGNNQAQQQSSSSQ